MRRLAAVFLLAVSFVGGVLLLNLLFFVQTPSGETEQIVRIERGTSPDRVMRELEEKNVISNGALFKAYVLFKRASGKIRAGEYRFAPRLKPREVLHLLLKGDFATSRITLPEGWTAKEMAGHLGQLHLVDPAAFLAKCTDPEFIRSLHLPVTNLEGYLYPDTYEIYRPKNEEEVLKKLVGRFHEIYTKDFEARAASRGLSQQEVVTLASMIEKETGAAEERPLIASVFLNRLKKGMPLASDPTVIYGLPGFQGNLTRDHLAAPTPYNTYRNAGLPPTPISNPGRESLRAVLYPAETNYLYFVSKNDGTHHFSETEAEHLAAVRRYQLNRIVSPTTRPAAP